MPQAGPIMRPLSGIARAFAAMRGRLYQPPRFTIAGVNPQNWPTANQPVQPIGPKGSQPLRFSFWQGLNLNITPRVDAPLTFADLRALSEYPLARMCIESVKDQLASLKWTIQLREMPGQSLADRRKATEKDEVIPRLTEFFLYPDGETPWSEWVRPLLEDLLVIDAPSILIQRTLSGQVVKLRVIDGSTVLRLVDDQGYTPQGDSPAFTQLWEGIPRVMLTTRQLVYRPGNIAPRNSVASQLYGYSITEQIQREIVIGSERLKYVLAFYIDGSVPGLVHVVPAGVDPDKLEETMLSMNSELAGQLSRRRQWRMVQGFRGLNDAKEDQIIQLKEPVLADAFDDVHIRKVCFGYGVSPQRLIKMIRTEGQASGEAAAEQGILPRLRWLKNTIDLIIQRQMGYAKYEAIWDTDTELDAVKQAEVDKIYVGGPVQVKTINEVRDDRGLEPRPEPEANQLMIITAAGAQPLEGASDRALAALKPEPKPETEPTDNSGEGNEPTASQKKKSVLTKSIAAEHPIRIDPARRTKEITEARKRLHRRMRRFFRRAARRAASAVPEATKLRKDAPPPPDSGTSERIEEEIDDYVSALMASIDWDSLVVVVTPQIQQAASAGASIGVADMNITATAVINEVNAVARDYATDRGAELVGKKWVNGQLIDNPDAKWAITDTTRNMLRQIVSDAFSGETEMSDLQEAIQQAGAFSEERAALIARTEVAMAQVQGNYSGWVKSGNVLTVRSILSGDHDVLDECDLNAEAGPIPIGKPFPSGGLSSPFHPRCQCVVIPVKVKGVDL